MLKLDPITIYLPWAVVKLLSLLLCYQYRALLYSCVAFLIIYLSEGSTIGLALFVDDVALLLYLFLRI